MFLKASIHVEVIPVNIEPSIAANSSNFDLRLRELRKECAKNTIIGNLNVNSL